MITLAAWLVSVTGMMTVAALGPSVAVPTVPGDDRWPPYALAVHPPAGLAYALTVLAAVSGALATWRLLDDSLQDRLWTARVLQRAGFLVAAVLTLLPPAGGDITSYLAYGHEAATGIDPYALGPQSHGVPSDALTRAVDSPWQTTPSVYGPAFTQLSAVIARLAGADAHVAATLTRVLLTGAFVLTGLVLAARGATDTARRRAAVLWSANPLMLFALVAGAHVDAVVACLLVCSFALVRRSPAGAGLLLGMSAALKATGLVGLPGLLWAVRSRPRACVAVLAGTAAVAVSCYAVTPGVFTQLRAASRFTTPAAPWRPLASLMQPALGYATARSITGALAAAVGLALIALFLRRSLPPSDGTVAGQAATITAAFAIGWVLTTPYVLPWYDALAWAPLALAAASVLDRVLLVHTAVLTIAMLPGRDVPLVGATDLIHRVVHSGLSPVVLGALVVLAARLAARRPVDASPLAVGPSGPGP